MARKTNGFDDLEEMRKDVDKLGEAMSITPARIRTPFPARKGVGAKPSLDCPLLRAPVRKRTGKTRKRED